MRTVPFVSYDLFDAPHYVPGFADNQGSSVTIIRGRRLSLSNMGRLIDKKTHQRPNLQCASPTHAIAFHRHNWHTHIQKLDNNTAFVSCQTKSVTRSAHKAVIGRLSGAAPC